MGPRLRVLWFPLVLAAAAAPSYAQRPADPEARISERYLPGGSEAATVDALTIAAGRPAWWTVSMRTSRVHILGVPGGLPPGVGWSMRDVEARVGKNAVVIIPPAVTEKDAASVSSLRLPDVGPIPPDLSPRIAAAAKRLGQPAERYLGQHPVIAGYLLASDFREAIGFREDGAVQDVFGLVGEMSAGARPISVFYSGAAPSRALSSAFRGLTAAGARTCLEAAIAEVEAGEAAARAAALAWRNGDVAGALAAPRSLDVCAFAAPALAERRRSGITDSSNTIIAILYADSKDRNRLRYPLNAKLRPYVDKGSDFVVLVNLRSLLAEDGVLDRLADKGFRIEN